jgi:hypothetical protein
MIFLHVKRSLGFFFYSGVIEYSALLGCDATFLGEWVPTFRRDMSSSFCGSDGPFDTSSSKRLDRFWGTGAISASVKRPKHDADHSSYPEPKLRATGAPLTHTPACRA